MQIKLLINITPIRKPLTGIGYYTLNILRELLKKNVEVIGLKNGKIITKTQLQEIADNFISEDEDPHPNQKSIKRYFIELIRSIPGSYQIKNILLSYRAQRALTQFFEMNYVYFEPSFIPLDYKGKTITTIHDLSFISYPEFHPKHRVTYLTSKIDFAINASDYVITDSDYILKDINDYFPLSRNKSSTVYLGVDEHFQHYTEAECLPVNQKLGIQYQMFILSVATLEPRKNLKRLVSAYKRMPDELKIKYPLVLVGEQGWKNTELFSEANELIEDKKIIFTGYLSDIDLKRLYASAMIFAYPSLYEGFGLPVIEAMASGVPVITSSRGATAEVAGDAALLVDPEDEQDISRAMVSLIMQPELRELYSDSALTRVSKYKWRYTVDNLLEIANSISNKC